MEKRKTVAHIKKAFKATRDADILSYALCMVGNIGEGWEEVKKTAELIREIGPDLFSCPIMNLYPESENYRTCRDNGWFRHSEWGFSVPSILKTRDYKLVSVTNRMN